MLKVFEFTLGPIIIITIFEKALKIDGSSMRIIQDFCHRLYTCVKPCYNGAIVRSGTEGLDGRLVACQHDDTVVKQTICLF